MILKSLIHFLKFPETINLHVPGAPLKIDKPEKVCKWNLGNCKSDNVQNPKAADNPDLPLLSSPRTHLEEGIFPGKNVSLKLQAGFNWEPRAIGIIRLVSDKKSHFGLTCLRGPKFFLSHLMTFPVARWINGLGSEFLEGPEEPGLYGANPDWRLHELPQGLFGTVAEMQVGPPVAVPPRSFIPGPETEPRLLSSSYAAVFAGSGSECPVHNLPHRTRRRTLRRSR